MPDPHAFRHLWLPPEDTGDTLLLLHGTGGDERDLVPLGRSLRPGAGILSIRGNVLENGMPRFFRRLSEGVFDEADLRVRAEALARFIPAAAVEYGFDAASLVAVGFSNGANMAGALLLLHPGLLRRAVLYRAMVPLRSASGPDLSGTRVLLSEGAQDPIVPRAEADELAGLLRKAGADVQLEWQAAGHGLVEQDLASARAWLGAAE